METEGLQLHGPALNHFAVSDRQNFGAPPSRRQGSMLNLTTYTLHAERQFSSFALVDIHSLLRIEAQLPSPQLKDLHHGFQR